jgi:hypothetical protein
MVDEIGLSFLSKKNTNQFGDKFTKNADDFNAWFGLLTILPLVFLLLRFIFSFIIH